MQNQARDQVIKALKEANNVLVTVKNGPTVDELAAAIALTLLLNRMNKHAITVFSGRVPSMLEFLQPEMAIDTNTDSLRDFIIALDKSKADKLRYKVEDNVVRIFITPYKTSISERDLEFSQGDFNVDVVVALGVVTKEDFDQAVTLHGRILHDATVIALTKQNTISQIGAVNWQQPQASSISEMIASITDVLGEDVVDGQIATALMTGIVAETDRFRNSLTTPDVMNISARLMSRGANQQLIAAKLEEPDMSAPVQPLSYGVEAPHEDGALDIAHIPEEVQNIHIDDHGNLAVPQDDYMPATEPLQPVPMQPYGATPVEMPAYSPDQSIQENFDQQQDMDQASRAYMMPAQRPKMYAEDDSGTVSMQPLFEPAQPLNTALQASFPTAGTSLDTHHKVIQPLPEGEEHGSYGRPFVPPSDIPATSTEPAYMPPVTSEQTEPPIDPVSPLLVPQAPAEPPVSAVTAPEPAPLPMPASEPVAEQQPPAPVPAPEPVPEPAPALQVPTPVNAGVQTLADLEQAVGSPHVQGDSQPTPTGNVDDFLGTTRTPAPVPTPEPVPEPQMPAPAPEPQEEKQEDEHKDENLIKIPEQNQTTPQVINPNAPPEVPPPLMPAPTQPQFYDADGNSANPFLNPN